MPNHPFNITYLARTMAAQLAPQTGHDKARSLWDADERCDGRPKTTAIQVLFVKPNELPALVTIPNELAAMQGLVGGTITVFETGVEGTVGLAHDEAVLLQMPPNRYIPTTKAVIFGPFFVAADGVNFHSLSEVELENALAAFVPPLTAEQVQAALQTDDDSADWIERSLREDFGD